MNRLRIAWDASLAKIRGDPEGTAFTVGLIGCLLIPMLVWNQSSSVKTLALVFSAPAAHLIWMLQVRLFGAKDFHIKSLANKKNWGLREYAIWLLDILKCIFLSGLIGLMFFLLFRQFS
jgi:hypothetical protein